MQVRITGRGVDVTDFLKEYAEKKLSKMTRYFDRILDASVVFEMEGNAPQVEITLDANGVILRGVERAENFQAALDFAIDKIEKQLRRFKDRLSRKYKVNIPHEEVAPLLEEHPEEEPKIVKVKRFQLKPMFPEEAIMQMDLLGHDFFVFLNAETNQVNVVYRRKDGNYGLIEPAL
ncbi:MAG: ribosome-associated translation inhibitor RaiA [Synergistetes bacterium]|nr:MAG: Ribosomal subunit interface protein [bacterium 42_11]MBC7330886.1 ribosome-associated translation inhibitor RaiA [Synergistota bacterium]MDK2870845.1 putative sigma-54 modulation protein [bacterium]